MAVYRLTWRQLGRLHCQDYPSKEAADMALFILSGNFHARHPEVRELAPGEEHDLTGPRPVQEERTPLVLDPDRWKRRRH